MYCIARCARYIVLALALVASACASDRDLLVGSARYAECPQWGCGTNDGDINSVIVSEIDLDALLLYDQDDSEASYAIIGFVRVEVILLLPVVIPMTLDVEDGMFVGTDIIGSTEHTGADLVGSMILLSDLSSGGVHAIIIDGFETIDSWTDPVIDTPAYRLTTATVDLDPEDLDLFDLVAGDLALTSSEEDICGAVLPAGPSTLAQHYAVLVKGERYSAVNKTVSVSGSSAEDWFNLGCNGSALAKMKLLGYDPEYADTATTSETTVDQRQATLKMITADYCGTGTSFTVQGEPLRWDNADGSVEPDGSLPAAVSSEAIWTEDGAYCLDTPRREDDEPDIADDIAAECGSAPPACSASEIASFASYGEWLTENPDES